MQVASLLVSICAVVISAASAAFAWLSTHPRPKLHGKITAAFHFASTGDADKTIILHCLLTNEVAQPVHIIGYRCRIKSVDGKWIELMRPIAFTLPTILLRGVGVWEVEMKPEHFIDWTPREVKFGSPLMGFLIFDHNEPVGEEEIQLYQLTVIDVFGREHTFSNTRDKMQAYLGKNMRNSKTRVNDVFPVHAHELFRFAGATMRRVDDHGRDGESHQDPPP